MFRFSEWNVRHPVLAIVLVSLLAVVINCHPIIFSGKSFVSPMSTGSQLVYNWWPPLPGMEKWSEPKLDNLHSVHGSDTATIMWWGVPAGFIESRSLLEHGELPLWNRYSHAGDTFIGQAVTMMGDPLQLIVIIGRGSAGAWDLKFLTAKFLFCIGFGLLIRRLTGSPVLSLIFSALAAYCGAYFYINSHQAFFVLTYAPWILWSAIEWLDFRTKRSLRWGLIWLLANFSCFNAGHLEVAVVLIGGLNFAAVANALARPPSLANCATVMGRMTLGTLLFLGLTAPVWLAFLGSLTGSYSTHMEVAVHQLPLAFLPGAFDDLFYLLIRPDDSLAAIAPGTSLLVLTGCCLAITQWRQLQGDPFFWINSGALVLWGGCVYGWIPASVLAAIPLLNRVGHNETDISYLLVIHLTIQCAYGFKCLLNVAKLRQVAFSFSCVVGMFAGLFVLYSFGYPHRPIPWNYFLCAEVGAVGAPMLFVFLKSRGQQASAAGWLGIIVLGFIPNFRFALYNTGNDALLMLPGPRAVLNTASPAVDKLKADKTEPFRVVGLQRCFMGDYASVYELEDIRSCAPLSNGEFVNVISNFPGMELKENWVISVVNPALAQPLLNMLNVKFLLTWRDVQLKEHYDYRIIDRSDFGVLENVAVWPRAFFASQVVAIDSTGAFIKHLVANARNPFVALNTAVVESQPGLSPLATTNPPAITPGTNYLLSVNSTEFDIHAPSSGVVCLTEGQAKNFIASANGRVKPVLTVNRAFKGIYLDKPGDYHIKFSYRPSHWRLACVCFWMSMAAIVALGTAAFIKKQDRKTAAPTNLRQPPAA